VEANFFVGRIRIIDTEKLRNKLSEKDLKADATVTNILAKENRNKKTPIINPCLLETDQTERKPENCSRRQT